MAKFFATIFKPLPYLASSLLCFICAWVCEIQRERGTTGEREIGEKFSVGNFLFWEREGSRVERLREIFV